MRLRKVTMADSELLLRWRNDPVTREMSIIKDQIAPTVHEAWLEKRLKADDCKMWIGIYGDAPIGVVRFDKHNYVWVVSLTVAPEARGNGLGEQLLDAGIEKMEGAILLADIRFNNAASILIFTRSAFKPFDCDGKFLRFRRLPTC